MANVIKKFTEKKIDTSGSIFPTASPKDKRDLLPKATNAQLVEQFQNDIKKMNMEQLSKVILELEKHRSELEEKLNPQAYQKLLREIKDRGH